MIFKKPESLEAAEAGMEEALKNFRSSVHAWSEAEFARPRTAPFAAHRRSWRMAVVWALGCVVAVAGVSAGVYQQHYRQNLAQMAAARLARQQQMATQEAAANAAAQAAAAQADATRTAATEADAAPQQQPQSDEKLMASVDKDVSQEVPSALEPLAQLMDTGASQ